MLRLFSLLFLSINFFPLHAQITGGHDYALGGSSVSWLPSSGALFLNPAELVQVRQGDFQFNAFRMTSLSSFSATHFQPFFGTLAAGLANVAHGNQYSLGYAASLNDHFALGIAASVFRHTIDKFGLSLGGSAHFPSGWERRSGLHVGLSVLNISGQVNSGLLGVNAGAGYWVFPDILRLQASFQRTSLQNHGSAGMDISLFDWLSLQVGFRSRKEASGGISIEAPFFSIDLAGSKNGGLLSLNVRLTEPAADRRTRSYQLGEEAMDGELYGKAEQHYRLALEYDPLYGPARTSLLRVSSLLRVETDSLLKRAKQLEERKNLVEATRVYTRLLQINPELSFPQEKLADLRPQIKTYVIQLVVSGDSLKNRKEVERARRSYQQALDLDPSNDSLSARIVSLEILAKENVRSSLSRAKAFLDRGQLDEAQREYERVLATEPRNTQARTGLEEVWTKRTAELFDEGKSAFISENYFEALTIFLDVLGRDDKNKDARNYLDRTREILQPEIDSYFRAGLQYYNKENYKSALQEWDKVLMINPHHQGTIEYRKRAEEKLKALERLK